MIQLPENFLERMKNQLAKEYFDFLNCYEYPAKRGIRINTLKMPIEHHNRLPMELMQSPFAPESFYVLSEDEKIGTSPYHHSGAIYSQEPSAAAAVTALDPQPGERILDMCAAPGGKSTQIGARLCGKGLLWANEYVRSRASTLISNIERMGVQNAVVSSAHPDVLANALHGYFDRVLVDAPCSGEGMFRKNPKAANEWSAEHTESCAVRQLEILTSAAKCLKEGGVMVYSTCTFAPEENEQVIERFLSSHREFAIDSINAIAGRKSQVQGKDTLRIYPMDGGEGHFVARMIKTAGTGGSVSFPEARGVSARECAFPDEIFAKDTEMGFNVIGENIYALPCGMPEVHGLGVLREGILAGRLKNRRTEPCHALFMAFAPEYFCNTVDLTNDTKALDAFLRGEELAVSGNLKGYCAALFDGMTIGFGKCSAGRLKNHYPKGLRNLK